MMGPLCGHRTAIALSSLGNPIEQAASRHCSRVTNRVAASEAIWPILFDFFVFWRTRHRATITFVVVALAIFSLPWHCGLGNCPEQRMIHNRLLPGASMAPTERMEQMVRILTRIPPAARRDRCASATADPKNIQGSDTDNSATATGGNGGNGGIGGSGASPSGKAGNGGAGGNGGRGPAPMSTPRLAQPRPYRRQPHGAATAGAAGLRERPARAIFGKGGKAGLGGNARVSGTVEEHLRRQRQCLWSCSRRRWRRGRRWQRRQGRQRRRRFLRCAAKGTAALFGTSTGGGSVNVYGQLWAATAATAAATTPTPTTAAAAATSATVKAVNQVDGQTAGYLSLSQDVYGGNGGCRS